MTLLLQMISSFVLLGVGFSQVLSPVSWQRHYQRLAGMGEAGAYVNGMTSLLFGGLLVLTAGPSGGLATAISLIGYLLVIEAAVAALAPNVSLEALKMAAEPWVAKMVVFTGFVLSAAGAMLAADVWWDFTTG